MKQRIKYTQVEGCSCCERLRKRLRTAERKIQKTRDIYERIVEEQYVRKSEILTTQSQKKAEK